MKCCLCDHQIDVQYTADGKVAWSQGHNAEPLITDGRCCSDCNWSKVIPARFGITMLGDKLNEFRPTTDSDLQT